MKKFTTAIITVVCMVSFVNAQVRLAFRPAVNGFHFKNDFKNDVDGLFKTEGLCGGMALAAFNFFRYNVPIPNLQTENMDYNVTVHVVPPSLSGTTELVNYIFVSELATYHNINALRFIGPLEPDYNEEYNKIKARIDRGEYTILGLRLRHGEAGLGHQVLCYGYNPALKELYIYDSNFPDQEITLYSSGQDIILKNATEDVSKKFRSFFEEQELLVNRVSANTEYTFDALVNQNYSVRPPQVDQQKPMAGFGYTATGFNYQAKLPPQNIYKFQNMASTKMVEVEDAAFAKGTKVQQFFNYERNGLVDGKNQQWLLIPAGTVGTETVFYIINNGFLKYLEAGSVASLENANDNNNQRWFVQSSAIDNIYYIKSVATQTYLQAPIGSFNDGDRLTLGRFNGAANQQFVFTRYVGLTGPQNYTPGTFVSINSQMDGSKTLNLPDASTNNGTGIQLYNLEGNSNNEHWQLTRTPDGYYKILSRLNTIKTIDITGLEGGNNSNLVLWDNADVEKQKWLIIPVARETGYYIFFNKVSGRCMDIAGGRSENHAAIQTYLFANAANQKWKIVPVSR